MSRLHGEFMQAETLKIEQTQKDAETISKLKGENETIMVRLQEQEEKLKEATVIMVDMRSKLS